MWCWPRNSATSWSLVSRERDAAAAAEGRVGVGHLRLRGTAGGVAVHRHGEVVRLAGFAASPLHDQACRDPGTAPRSLRPSPPGWHPAPFVAESRGFVCVDMAVVPRTTPTPHRDTSHAAGMA